MTEQHDVCWWRLQFVLGWIGGAVATSIGGLAYAVTFGITYAVLSVGVLVLGGRCS